MGNLKRTYFVCYQKNYRNRRRRTITICIPDSASNASIIEAIKQDIANIGMKTSPSNIKLNSLDLLKEETIED